MDTQITEAPADVEVEPVADTAACPCCDTYEKFVDNLCRCWESFLSEAREGEKNKAAALRARKASLALRRNLQEFREVSIANDKTITK